MTQIFATRCLFWAYNASVVEALASTGGAYLTTLHIDPKLDLRGNKEQQGRRWKARVGQPMGVREGRECREGREGGRDMGNVVLPVSNSWVCLIYKGEGRGRLKIQDMKMTDQNKKQRKCNANAKCNA